MKEEGREGERIEKRRCLRETMKKEKSRKWKMRNETKGGTQGKKKEGKVE